MGRVKTTQERERKYVKQRYIMSNLVYFSQACGPLYANFWLDNQLKTLLDKTNLPALKERYELEYVLFTDDESMPHIQRHPNFMALGGIAEITLIKMGWPPDSDKFQSRYGLLAQMFQQLMQAVFAEPPTDPEELKSFVDRRDAWVSVWVADLVFAKHSLGKMLQRLEEGHDAVFNVPIRCAADAVQGIFNQLPGAPSDLELFELAYKNLHHLWVASHWDAPLFSKFPYSMLWNSGSGLVAHNFGITPIMFKPNKEMLGVQGVIDADVPSFCKNPYWATDWTDAAVAGVEPLSNGHYPPFLIHKADPDWIAEWASKGTMPVQADNLDKPLYYPCKSIFNKPELAALALATALDIQTKVRAKVK